MMQAQSNDEMLFRRWQELHISRSLMQEELRNQGLSSDEISSIVEKYTRYRIDQRNAMGWTWMGLGGFLGLVSCVLTIIDLVPAFRGVFMYGLTSLAVTLAMYGCYLVMEKPNDEET